uniref:Kinesin-like protein n=1 Tax=Pavo cristatus TaxID=9049 RepID=A0A8C9EQQ9_PAVCR
MHAVEKKVRAFVRVKPTAQFAQDVIKFGPDNKSIDIYIKKDAKKGVVNNKQTDWSFKLDGVLHNTSQELMYETVAKKLVSEALIGYNGTIMCYGQTGAGKTYTMTGATAEYRHRGIIPRAVQQDCFNMVNMFHLISTTPFCFGETNRVIAEHTLNKNSSRSHCIFTIYIESRFRVLSDVRCINSKINLIDLAGSERLSKTGSEGRVLKEAAYINKSLSFLEQIIIALADPKREHIPFRQSKLTHVLKDSLGKGCGSQQPQIECMENSVSMSLSALETLTHKHMNSEESELFELVQLTTAWKCLLVFSLYASFPQIMNFRQVQEVFRQFKLIVRQQEDEVETRLRSKYVLIDKNDFATIAAAQKVMAGAWCALVPVKEGTKSLFSGRDLAAHLPSKSQVMVPPKNVDVKEKARNEDTANIDAQPSKSVSEEISQRPSSPPSRAVAFEQFKEECGSEINRIFKENKSILLARRKRSSTVARRINIIKQEMEDIKKALEAQRQERSQQGEYVDEKGRLIIDEKEFLLIMKLKDLKEEYRCSYAELQDLKAEIQYCQHLVDRCRNKLISEFEIWYSESFLIPTYMQNALKPSGNIRPGMIPINRVMCLEEDEQDRFERMQEAMLPAGPDSVAFYKAKMKTDQKVMSAAPSSL